LSLTLNLIVWLDKQGVLNLLKDRGCELIILISVILVEILSYTGILPGTKEISLPNN